MSPAAISIKVTDEEPCYAVAGADVEILVQSGRAAGQEHGSSRVKLKNIVDYKWEVKKYHGRLIAVHRDAQVIAYSIKLKTGAGVRVVWNGERALIKGMANEVLDLQFAHMSSKIILACVDESSLHVYRVDTSPGKLDTALLLRVDSAVEDVPLSTHRINWCPFVPSATPTQQTTTAMDISATGGAGAAGAAEEEVDGSEEDFANHLLVWIQGDTFQALNIHLVVEGHGTGTFDYAELSEGVVQHRESKATITVATFSPDGTTLAVGYEDGNVYFYQMYLYSKETTPRRLYHWRPHDNKPVSALAFLDDHTVVRPSEAGGSFWKHALTATDHNTEIKLWRCDDWSCIQRICFKPTAFDSRLDFKLDIDASSSYLVLSEQTNRVLYALQIARPQQQQQGEGGDAVATSTVAFKAVAEFPLSSSILSFGIAGATKGKYQCGRLQDDDLDEYEQEEADADPMVGAMIQMFLVQPKSVQECQVFFQTETAGRDMDISLEVSPGVAATDLTQHFYSPVAGGTGATSAATAAAGRQKSSAQINLMTPESFQSPPQQSDQGVSSSVLTTIRMLAASATADTPITPESMLSYAVLEERNKALRKSLAAAGDQPSSTTLDPLPIASSTVNTSEILPSGNSSPSREVQEILSLKDEMFENHLQSSDLDMELEVNSSGGNGTEVDEDDDEEEEDEEEETVGEVAATNNNVNLTTTTTTATTTTKKKVLDGIASIKLYVDDDEEDNNETGAEEGGGGGVGSDKTTEISSSSNLEWPKVPNILPDMARIAAPELNNLNGGSNSGVECKLDRILDQLGALERRFAQLEQQQQQPPPSQYTDKLAVTLDRHIKSCELVMKHELEAVLKRQTEAMRETVLQAMQQQQQQVKERATGNLLAELRPQLMALVARELENIKGMLQYEVANKLSTSDQLLRENLNYVCTNKSLMESFAAAIRSGVQHTVQVTFMEQINKLIVPAYERATKEMFKQTNDMFQKGVVNYSKQVHSYMTQFQPVHEQQERLLTSMRALPEQFKVTSEKVVNSFSAQIIHEVNKDFKTLQLNVLKLVKETVKQEVSKGFESQAASLEDSVLSAVRSQAQTPSVFDLQEQIRQLVHQGQINKAFHQALISNDLSLVEFTLETADSKEVFNPCRLEQTVLLSLIQQLSADMSAYSPTKHQYLSEAITSLNMSDTVIREHAPKILKQLSRSLQKYTEDHPNGQFNSRIKMLSMMIQGFAVHFPL